VDAVQFTELLAAHGLANHVTSPTHNLGDMLDVIVSRVNLPPLLVGMHDVGLSDQQLLQWSAQLMRPAPVYTTATSRPWARLDADAFRAALLASPLCQRDTWSTLDIDDLAQLYLTQLYDNSITAVLDDILPLRTVRCQRRSSILLHRLVTSHDVNGVVHTWISSYLANRTQYIRCPGSRSTQLMVLCGVP